MWCVLECSGNLFTSSTLFGKVNKHFYLIDYELHVSDTDLSPLSLFSLTFAIKQIIKKKIQLKSGLWMFNYVEQIFRLKKEKSIQISTLFRASLSFLGKMVIFARQQCQKLKKISYILLKVEFVDDCAKTRGVVLSRQECSTSGAKYTQRTSVFFFFAT